MLVLKYLNSYNKCHLAIAITIRDISHSIDFNYYIRHKTQLDTWHNLPHIKSNARTVQTNFSAFISQFRSRGIMITRYKSAMLTLLTLKRNEMKQVTYIQNEYYKVSFHKFRVAHLSIVSHRKNVTNYPNKFRMALLKWILQSIIS